MLTPFSHSFLRNLTAKLVWLHNVTCELKVQYKEPKENQESSFYFVKLDLSQTFLCALFCGCMAEQRHGWLFTAFTVGGRVMRGGIVDKGQCMAQ